MTQHDRTAKPRSPFRGILAGLVVLVIFCPTARQHIGMTICIVIALIIGAIGTLVVLSAARQPR